MKPSFVKTISYTLARLVSASVGVFAVLVYTQMLRQEEYGLYAIAFATVSVFNALLFHWIAAATARVYPRYLNDIPAFVGTVVRFWLLSVGVLAVLTLLAWASLPASLRGVIAASSVLLVTTSMYEFALELSRSGLRTGAYAIAVVVYALLGLASGALLAFLGLGAISPLLGLSVGQFAAVVVLWFMGVLEMRQGTGLVERRAIVRHMVLYGVPLSGAIVLSMILASVDRYLIEHFLDLSKVAVYAATYSLVFPSVVLVASVINLMGYPRIMRAYEVADSATVDALLRQQITALLSILVPVLLGAFILAKPLELTLPQGKYLAGVPLLPYIMLAAFLNVLRSTYVDLALHITHAVKWLVVSLLVAIAVGVCANVALLPRLGIEGAAFSLCFCYATALAMSLLATRGRFRLPLPKYGDGAAILFGAALMVVALKLAPVHAGWVGLIVSVIVGGGAYVLGFGATWLGWRRIRSSEVRA